MPRRVIDPGVSGDPSSGDPSSGELVSDVLDKLNLNFRELYGVPGLTEENPLEPPLPLIWSCPPTGSATPNAANEFRGTQIHVPGYTRINRARVRCSSSSAAVFAVGIYAADGSQRVTWSAPVAVPSSEENVAVPLGEVVLGPGFYYVGLSCSLAGVFWTMGRHALFGGGSQAGADPSALPASVAVGNAAGTNAPCVGLYYRAAS